MDTQLKGRLPKAKRYRLSLVNADTHETLQSITFSRINGIGVTVGAVVVLICLMYCLLVLTPLRRTIPGYPDQRFRARAVENAIRIDSLESAMARWEIYSENLARILSGEQTLSLDSILATDVSTYLRSQSDAYLHEQDSLLRAKVRKEERFAVSGGARRDLPLEGIHFFTPVKGVVTSRFDRATHPAVDISAPANTVVKSVLDGTVIYAGWSDEYGYTVQIQHGGDLVSTYKHNQRLLKKAGDKVTAGTPISHLGGTGSLSTASHLHFELWYKGSPVDPEQYINF